MDEFEENIRKPEDKLSVWHHFFKSKSRQKAKCKHCTNVLSCAGSSTSALRSHLKNKHLITLKTEKTACHQPDEEAGPSKKPKKITEYLKETDSMELTVSRMVTLDGISFRLFANSVDLRRLFKKSNYTLPSSANTIKNIVMQYSQNTKQEIKCLITALKKRGEKFSLTADEWVSNRNRRYMNVNLHSPDLNDKHHINLGLARLEGSATAIKCANTLENRIKEFDLSLEDDISGLTTDGAAAMVKMGKCLPVYHQLCYAHALQLAVLDVLYKKRPVDSTDYEISDNERDCEDLNMSDSDSDDEEDGISIETENRQRLSISSQGYKDLIEKVRRTVLIFKRSTTKNDDVLQKYVKEQFGHDMSVILDCKTRWSSLCNMVDRFLALNECLQKAMLDLKSDIRFTEGEITCLKELKEALEIVKGVVEVLCLEDATLLTADTALKYMFKKLSSIHGLLSFELQSALKKRISERYLLLQGVLKYLDNAQEYFNDSESIFTKPSTDFIKSIIAKTVIDENNSIPLAAYQNLNTASSTPTFKNFKEELIHAIKPTTSSTTPSLSAENSDSEIKKMVLCEMALHENGGGRGKFLTKTYKALLTIKPTSVESERAFSTAGYFCSKIRSRLNDSTLDALLFLRSHFLAKK